MEYFRRDETGWIVRWNADCLTVLIERTVVRMGNSFANYMENSHMSMKQAAGFLFTGAMVGAAVALLYAPQSGARTTKDLRRFSRKTVTRLDDLQGNIRDQVMDWVGNITDLIKDGVNFGKKLGAEGYEQAVQGFDNAKKCVEDGKSRLEHFIKTA
jgi:gas vesicle protein